MMNLTFLIQKEGDREWLPLESPTVEVLEGRYHLLAHTGLDQPIDIQIRHRYEDNGILQEELQQRRQKPDTHGNLDLLPVAYLGRGLWTLTCSYPAEQAEVSRQSINLQVLAEDYDLISDWTFVESKRRVQSQAQTKKPPIERSAANPLVSASISAQPETDSEAAAIANITLENQQDCAPSLNEVPEQVTTITNQSYVVELEDIASHSSTAAVNLPTFPQKPQPVQFQQSEGISLPPELSPIQKAEEQVQALDLPTFPRNFHWRYIPLNKLSKVKRLRQVRNHHAEIEEAFTALELQQRFWQNVHQLVDPIDTLDSAEQILVRVDG